MFFSSLPQSRPANLSGVKYLMLNLSGVWSIKFKIYFCVNVNSIERLTCLKCSSHVWTFITQSSISLTVFDLLGILEYSIGGCSRRTVWSDCWQHRLVHLFPGHRRHGDGDDYLWYDDGLTHHSRSRGRPHSHRWSPVGCLVLRYLIINMIIFI